MEKDMSDIVFGEIDWNTGDDSGSGQSKTEFMRLEQGENTVRIMANPVQFYIHWVETPEGKMRKVNSPISSPDLVRRLEDADFKRRPRWMVKVLDRSDDTFKLLEIGTQIYSGVKALFNHKKWGKVTAYDLTIERGPKGAQPLYRVTPDPKEPLDARFQESFVKFNDNLNLDRLISPGEPEEICKILGWSDESGATVTEVTADQGEGFFDFKS
jgi:hypothetical protein